MNAPHKLLPENSCTAINRSLERSSRIERTGKRPSQDSGWNTPFMGDLYYIRHLAVILTQHQYRNYIALLLLTTLFIEYDWITDDRLFLSAYDCLLTCQTRQHKNLNTGQHDNLKMGQLNKKVITRRNKRRFT